MQVSEQDLEQLELYLDHELSDVESRELDARVSAEPALSAELVRLRGGRATRLEAMSTAFDTDAASIERLVGSVRMAQASEAFQIRRKSINPMRMPLRSVLSAAACVAVGLFLGVTLQRQHGASGGMTAAPVGGTITSSFLNSNVSMMSNTGVYVVSVKDAATGHEVYKLRFQTQEEARQFIDHINSGSSSATPLNIGDAHILDEPF